MKKVTIYFKSGNKMFFKCKEIIFDISQPIGERTMSVTGGSFERVAIDFTEVEAITVKDCWF